MNFVAKLVAAFCLSAGFVLWSGALISMTILGNRLMAGLITVGEVRSVGELVPGVLYLGIILVGVGALFLLNIDEDNFQEKSK